MRCFVVAVLLGALWLNASPAVPAVTAEPAAIGTTEGTAHPEEEDMSMVLLGHVLDSGEWELLPGLPTVRLPQGMTVHLLMLWLATGLICGGFLWGFRRRHLRVTGIANALELVVVFVRDDIVYPVMGEERGERWVPFFTTLFVFLLAVNYLGMIPAFRTATGNINVTTSLAVMVMLLTFGVGIAKLGMGHFITNMYPDGAPFPIGVFVCCLELTGIFVKSLVLSLRLFANMLAGHLAILSLLAMIFILSPWFCSISLPLAVFVYALEVLVALIQALVFTLLSCIFISMASTSHAE